MGVIVSNIDALVTDPVRDCRCRESHVDQEADVAMPEVMNSYPFHACRFSPLVHLPMKGILRQRENPIRVFNAVELAQIIPNLFGQEPRHPNRPIALLGLRGRDTILTVDSLIGFIDGDRSLLQIKIRGRQGQQFPFPDTAPVQHLEGVVGNRIVHLCVREFQVLLFRPESHLAALVLSHASGLPAGILSEVIELHRMIEDCAELTVQGFQVDRGIRIPLLVPVIHQLILPSDDLLGRDAVHFQPSEVRNQLRADDVFLHSPCVFFQPRSDVQLVLLREALEGHVQISFGHGQRLAFPGNRLSSGLESPLGALLFSTSPVRGSINHAPCARVFLLVDRHLLHPPFFSVVADLFHEILAAHPTGDGQVSLLLQLFVENADDLVGVGLGDPQFLRHFFDLHERLFFHLIFTSFLVTKHFCLVLPTLY